MMSLLHFTVTILLFSCRLAPTTGQLLTDGSPNSTKDEYAYCGDCHCINGNEPCPELATEQDFNSEFVTSLKLLNLTNPHTLSCNPYEDENCTTTPAQILTKLGDEAVCAIKYEQDSDDLNDLQCSVAYTLVTYASRQEAEADGAYLTHWGACGVCSTTQDLAVYIEYIALVEKGVECAVRGFVSFDDAIDCYMEVGYSEPCARMWVYNAGNTQNKCLVPWCAAFQFSGAPNNGPAPNCTLADCLQCDEDESGPLFTKVAGRSRRRSGLLSKIARPCDAILQVDHVKPCDAIKNETTDLTPSLSPVLTSGGMPIMLSLGLNAVAWLVAVAYL